MTVEERERWDQRYAAGGYQPRDHPTPLLVEWVSRIPVGRALDLATGAGRNALFLAESGFDVDAIDGSPVAIDMARKQARERGLDVTWRVADLDDVDLSLATWDLITVIRYRDPGLWPRIVDALAPNGWVVVDHHLVTGLEVDGPPSDQYRLRPQELLDAFSSLRIVHYSESLERSDMSERMQVVARLVACKGDPGF